MLNKIQSEREDTMVAQERMKTQQHYYTINWAHRSVDKHTTHKIDHTIYSAIKEWNSAKMACNCECFY